MYAKIMRNPFTNVESIMGVLGDLIFFLPKSKLNVRITFLPIKFFFKIASNPEIFFLKDDFLGQHLDLLDVCALLMIFCIRIDLNAIAIFANILSPAAAAVVFSGSEIVDRKKNSEVFYV